MPSALALTLVGAFGLVIGSFLNVCVYRLPSRASLVWPGSHCPACGESIRWFDNIPVVSYLVLAGRCRTCRARIPMRYPLIELATMGLFLAHVAMLGLQPLLVVRLAFSSALVVLFAIDLEHQILPNSVTIPGIVVGLASSLVLPPGWFASLLGVLLGGGSLWALFEIWVRLRHEEPLGGGDVKMLAMIGAFLGWKQVVLTLLLSSSAGSLVGLGLIAIGKGNLKSKLPYGTFLAVGAAASSLFGDAVIAWYVSFY